MSKKRVYKVVETIERYYDNLEDAFSFYQKENLIKASDLVEFRDLFLVVCDEDINDEVFNEKQSKYV